MVSKTSITLHLSEKMQKHFEFSSKTKSVFRDICKFTTRVKHQRLAVDRYDL